MNRFPEVFIRSDPPLKSRIAQMRYLGTLPASPLPPQFPPPKDQVKQKEVQTSPESSYMKGFYGEGQTNPATFRPVIKIPSPPLLTSGLLTRAGLEIDRKRTASKVISLRGRSVSPPQDTEPPVSIRRKVTQRPESVPLPANSQKQTKAVVTKERKSPESGNSISETALDPSESIQIQATAHTALGKFVGFREFTIGNGRISERIKGLIAFSSIFGQRVKDEERKEAIGRAFEAAFDMELVDLAALQAFHHSESMDYYAILPGDAVPLTLCCQSPFLLQLSANSEMRLICTHDSCRRRLLHSFPLADPHIEKLWKLTPEDLSETVSKAIELDTPAVCMGTRLKAISMRIQTGSYRSRSLRSDPRTRQKFGNKTDWLVPAFVDMRTLPMSLDKVRKKKALAFTNEKLKHIRMRATLAEFRRDPGSPLCYKYSEGDQSRVFSLPKDAKFSL